MYIDAKNICNIIATLNDNALKTFCLHFILSFFFSYTYYTFETLLNSLICCPVTTLAVKFHYFHYGALIITKGRMLMHLHIKK